LEEFRRCLSSLGNLARALIKLGYRSARTITLATNTTVLLRSHENEHQLVWLRHAGHRCWNLSFGTGSSEFILFISALVVMDQMTVSSLYRYQIRTLAPILINLLINSQLAKNFIFLLSSHNTLRLTPIRVIIFYCQMSLWQLVLK
jgi:hypothetical protein